MDSSDKNEGKCLVKNDQMQGPEIHQLRQISSGLVTQTGPVAANSDSTQGDHSRKQQDLDPMTIHVTSTSTPCELNFDDLHVDSEAPLMIVATDLGLHALGKSLKAIKNQTWLRLDENNFNRLPINVVHQISNLVGISMNKQCAVSNVSIQSEGQPPCNEPIIFTIPDAIHALGNLVELSLQNNKITALPYHIIGLENLKFLDVTGNCISYLCDEVFSMLNLEYLSLENNLLKIIPHQIGQLLRLRVLKLSKNLLHNLPDTICQLNDLIYLSVANNDLTYLPPRLYELEHCNNSGAVFSAAIMPEQCRSGIDIHGNNNLILPPAEICEDASIEELFEYLRRVDRNEKLRQQLIQEAQDRIGDCECVLKLADSGYSASVRTQEWRRRGSSAYIIQSILGSCDPEDLLGDYNLFMIAEQIPTHWQQLGLLLKLPQHMLDAINLDKNKVHEKALAMLQAWRNRNDTGDVAELQSALLAIQRNDLAQRL